MAASAEPQVAGAERRAERRPGRRRQQLAELLRLARLNRPVGIWLLLWPTLWALWFAAGGVPPLRLLLVFVLGTVVMRSAGCVVNDLLDRNIDPYVRRTRERPLAARRVSPYTAIALACSLGVVALALALLLNAAALRLAVIGAALTVTYPLFKRFFPVPQLYLGLCFGWGIPMAFAATLGVVPRAGWLLLLAAMLWACIYDTFSAMADRADDARIGVRSSAISFGDLDLLIIGAMQLMMLLALWLVGHSLLLGRAYYVGLAGGALLFALHLWMARSRERNACFRAFLLNHWFGVVLLAGIVVQYGPGRLVW